MSDREKVINDLQMQVEELEERLAIVLEGQPEIVRCKDCEFRDEYGVCIKKRHFAEFVEDNYYCADGERKQ